MELYNVEIEEEKFIFKKNDEQIKLDVGILEKEQQDQALDLFDEFQHLFASDIDDLRQTHLVQHTIELKSDAQPVKRTLYPMAPEQREFLQKEIKKMLSKGLIRESSSPWGLSPLVVPKKGPKKWRFCVDYRPLNKLTKEDSTPIPRIDQILESFVNAKWFSNLDMFSGYWQIAMAEQDKEKTAFVTTYGTYEYNVMPFGLNTAPATFQRLMNKVLWDYIGHFVWVYLDDVVIYSKTFEEHLQHLQTVFEQVQKASMQLNIEKCRFFSRKIHFLGHVISDQGIEPDETKIDKVRDFPVPRNLKELRGFVGLASYYRRFIPNFAQIAKALTKLTRKNVEFIWEDEQELAFQTLKNHLTTYPILRHPDFERPFYLYTDASGTALGAVLQQIDEDGRDYVIAYASRSLTSAEQNYSTTEQECLAVVWAIEKFHHYLGYRKFFLITDHAALKWLQSAAVKGRLLRWTIRLQPYKFEVIHKAGKKHTNADALSRIEVYSIATDESDHWDFTDDWRNSELEYNYEQGLTDPESFNDSWSCAQSVIEEEIIEVWDTPWYTYTQKEIKDFFQQYIKVKQVIAGQPITKGGSKCDFHCDIENHHLHTYCTICKRNLPYGTKIHECKLGITEGKIRPPMNPKNLVNTPWWKVPALVVLDDLLHYIEQTAREIEQLPL
jgi:hypothetical protein